MYNCNAEMGEFNPEINIQNEMFEEMNDLDENADQIKTVNKPSDIVFVDAKSIDKTCDMIFNTTCNKYVLYPTENPIVDVPTRLNEENINNYVILTKDPSRLNRPFPNNVIDLNSITQDKLEKQINWILTSFGKNKKMTDDVFVIGDCHFWHSNIIKYCNRPWWKKDESGCDIPDVETMNEEMIKIWNSIITSDKQTVYVNGDFCFGNKTKVKEIFDRLNGRKRIVLGNHDRCKFKDYYDIGFDRVYDKPILLANFCVLSHEPLQWIKDGDVYMNVYAHVHTQEMYKDYTSNSFCTSAERLKYKPIRFTEIFEKCQTYSKTVASD